MTRAWPAFGRPRSVWLVIVGALAVASCTSPETVSVATLDPAPAASRPTSVAPNSSFDVEGHRGARGLRPENTLPAFEVALDLGVSTLELDLHLSSDGQVIVWHDPFVDPSKCRLDSEIAGLPNPDTANEAELAIRSLTAAQLGGYICDRNPDVGRYPDQRADPGELAGLDYRIVTLTELFGFVASYTNSEEKTPKQRANAAVVQFNIETKRVPNDPATIGDDFDGSNPGQFELTILEDVQQSGMAGRVIIQSFDHRSLKAINSVNNEIRLAALTRDPVGNPGAFADWGAKIWSPRASTLTAASVEAAHQADLLVIPWTVNDIDHMQSLIEMGVDGIITDRPDLLLP